MQFLTLLLFQILIIKHTSIFLDLTSYNITSDCAIYYFFSSNMDLLEFFSFHNKENYLKKFDEALKEVYPEYLEDNIRSINNDVIHLCNVTDAVFINSNKIYIYVFIRMGENDIKKIIRKDILRVPTGIVDLKDFIVF